MGPARRMLAGVAVRGGVLVAVAILVAAALVSGLGPGRRVVPTVLEGVRPGAAGARAAALGSRQPAATASCSPVWTDQTTPNPGSSFNFLSGMWAASSADVWAVGHYVGSSRSYRTLIERWTGATWSQVTSPNQGTGDNFLRSVSGATSSDVWSVGHYQDAGGVNKTLAIHWNGTAWSVVSTPNVGSADNVLRSVSAASASDVWAVGSYDGGTGQTKTLVLHWNGTAWSVTTSPNGTATSNFLYGVAARSGDAWAVGYASNDGAAALQTLILHWNGTTWAVTTSPNSGTGKNNLLVGVAAISASDAWAVGYTDGSKGGQPVAMHWNGSVWTITANPSNTANDARLYAVAAVSSNDVWAVGTSGTPLVQHWNGTAWATATGPTSFSKRDLQSAAALSTGQAWASGFTLPGTVTIERVCPVSVTDSGFAPATSTIDPGGTVAWTFPASNQQSHTVTDASGMGLFDSGSKGPASSYTFPFTVAGTYSVVDSLSGRTSTMKVKLAASPASGGLTTVFTVTWASAPIQTGYAVDVQIRRPGSSSWVDWKTGQSGTKANFVADAGVGTYSFRDRLRNLSNSKTSRWSAAVSIVVS